MVTRRCWWRAAWTLMTTIRRLPMAVPTSRTSTAPITCQCLQGMLADAPQAAAAGDSAGRVAAAIGVQADEGVAAAAAVVADGVRVDRAVALRAAAAETARPERKREG